MKDTEDTTQIERHEGPVEKRHIHDIFFVILFALYWIGMIAIAILAINKGNVKRLIYGIDSNGYLCGDVNIINGTVTNLTQSPYLFYFSLSNPDTSYKICLSKCPSKDEIICKHGAKYANKQELAKLISNGTCVMSFNTTSVFYRCIPPLNDGINLFSNTDNESNKGYIRRMLTGNMNEDLVSQLMRDVVYNWHWICLGSVVALVTAILWALFIQYFTGIVVWSSICSCLLLMLGSTTFFWCYYKGITIDQAAFDTLKSHGFSKAMTLIISIILSIATLFLLLFIIIARKRIELSIEIIKQAAKATRAIPSTFIVLTAKYFWIVAIFAWCIFIFAILTTSGDQITQNINLHTKDYINIVFQKNSVMKWFFYYYLFGLFWNVAFILALGDCTISGAFAIWYWTLDKKNLPKNIVLKSFWRSIRYHMGSLLFGALILAFVWLIRFILEQFRQRVKSSKNKAAIYIANCLSCCFLCIEKFIRYVSTMAYIEIAVYGYSFCSAIQAVGAIISRNTFRAFVLEGISNVILLMARLSIMLFSTLLTSYFILSTSKSGLFSVISIITVFIVSLVISNLFISIMDMAIKTVFICFLEDCEHHDGSPDHPYYMPKGLIKFASKRPDDTTGDQKA